MATAATTATTELGDIVTLASLARRWGLPESSLKYLAKKVLPDLPRLNGWRMCRPEDVEVLRLELVRRGKLPDDAT